MCGRGVYLGVSYASHPKTAESSAFHFGGSHVFMPTPFDAERPNSARNTHIGRGVFYEVSHATDVSRGLSATAEFLVLFRAYRFYDVVMCYQRLKLKELVSR